MYFRWVVRVLEHIPLPCGAATSHGRQPKHPPAAQESTCAGVVNVYDPAGAIQQPYSGTCPPFHAVLWVVYEEEKKLLHTECGD